MTESRSTIALDATDLSDETVLVLLAGLQGELPSMLTEPGSDRAKRLLAAGMALAGEAWRRSLINAAPPAP